MWWWSGGRGAKSCLHPHRDNALPALQPGRNGQSLRRQRCGCSTGLSPEFPCTSGAKMGPNQMPSPRDPSIRERPEQAAVCGRPKNGCPAKIAGKLNTDTHTRPPSIAISFHRAGSSFADKIRRSTSPLVPRKGASPVSLNIASRKASSGVRSEWCSNR